MKEDKLKLTSLWKRTLIDKKKIPKTELCTCAVFWKCPLKYKPSSHLTMKELRASSAVAYQYLELD